MALLFNKLSIEIRGGEEYTTNYFKFKDLYKKQTNNQMGEENIIHEIENIYNRKWHYAKISAIQVADKFFSLRNHKQHRKDGTEEWFGDIFNYSENNIGTQEQNKQWNKHLNQWNPDKVKEIENIFNIEDYSTSVFGTDKDLDKLIVYNIGSNK